MGLCQSEPCLEVLAAASSWSADCMLGNFISAPWWSKKVSASCCATRPKQTKIDTCAASTSAYVKVLPKPTLAAGHRVVVLAHVLVDVLVGNLPLESVSKAVIAKFLRRAQNRKSVSSSMESLDDVCGIFGTCTSSRRSRRVLPWRRRWSCRRVEMVGGLWPMRRPPGADCNRAKDSSLFTTKKTHDACSFSWMVIVYDVFTSAGGPGLSSCDCTGRSDTRCKILRLRSLLSW